MSTKIKYAYICLGLLIVAFSATLLATGQIAWAEVWRGALARISGETGAWNALLDERIPRLIVLLCTGASLAASGAIMQSLLQNPLAAPTILGLTAGSSLMVVLVFITGWHVVYSWSVPFAAILGSLLVLGILSLMSRHQERRPFSELILLGIAIATLLLAIQQTVLYAFRDNWQLIQVVTEWEAGSSFDRSWEHVHMQLPLTLIGLAVCFFYRNEMNILSLGDEEARTLGVDVRKVRWRLILSVSLLSGGATAALGSVPFFGLILPHLLRRLFSSNHRVLIPLCIFGGAATLVAFDLLLRQTQLHFLTIGNLSAIFGGIFFLFLLRRKTLISSFG
ncbi:MAG: iron ABC transporter permease [Parachlamydiales bacterium]|jgi:iron complex transport system permease protein